MGFVTPIAQWLRGPLAQTARGIADSRTLAGLEWFDEGAISKVAEDHIAGRSDNARLLWQLIMLEKSVARVFG